MIIYSKDGSQKCEVKKFTYNGTFLGETFITFTITNEIPIEFAIGDYCIYREGLPSEERFELNYIPSKSKVASKNSYGEAFKYDDVKFNFLANELVNCSFLDYVPSGNSLHYNGLSTFTFTGTVSNLAERIKANLDRLYIGDKAWTITVAPEVESETINVNASNINCFEALSLAKSEFDLNFIIRNRTITIGSIGIDAGRTFGYGKGNGLISIKQTVNNDSKIITRLRAFGSSKNIPSRWYNKQINPSTGLPYIPDSMYVPNLMLPDFLPNGGDAYIEDSLISQLSYDGGNATSNTVIYTFDGGTSVVTPSITLDGGNAYSGTSYVDTYGVREGTVYFDGTGDNEEIYPSIKGITKDQLAELGIYINLQEGDNGDLDEIYSAINPTDNGIIPTDGTELNGTFSVELKNIGFNLSEKLSDGSYKYSSTDGEITLSMTSGNCAARDFIATNITRINTSGIITYKLDLNRNEDTDIGMAFPNSTYPILSGDTFVLINIQMPDVWVNLASNKLLTKALEYLSVNNKPKYSYELNIDNIFMANNPSIGGSLKEGDTITFEDLDLPVSSKVIISSLEIKEGESLIPQYAVTLSNDITVSTIQQILNSVNDNQIAIEQTKKDILTYTGRSFADVKETADALALAFNNYSAGITPAYVNALSLIAGTESQQFRFVDSNTTNTPNIINYGFKWTDNGAILGSDTNKYLQHLTLGINSLTPSSYARDYTEYKFWYLAETAFFNVQGGLKYVYAKCNRNSIDASYELSDNPYVWDADVTYYYFLVGILNSIKDGSRNYTEVYGYTEILPSRITTEKVISSNGINYFDLGANKFHLGTSDESSFFDWNNKIAGGLKIKGVIAQSQSGDESPIGVYRGNYNNLLVYYVGDLVTYNGSTYRCKLLNTAGIIPTNNTYWYVYASSGIGITSISEYYLVTSASSGITTDSSGWEPDIQTMTEVNKYLWNYEEINYSNGTIHNTDPVIIGVYGDKGVGISSVIEHYLATSANSGVTIGTSGWTTSIQTITSVNKYLWNYETINYTDSTFSNTDPVIIGVYGDNGLSTSSVTVTGNQVFKYAKGSSIPTNTSIILSAVLQNLNIAYQWKYYNGTDWVDFTDATSSTYTLAYNNSVFTGDSLRIRCVSAGYFDEITIVKLYDGSDTLNAILTNESIIVACDKDGNPKTGEIAKASTGIQVYRGTTLLTWNTDWVIDELALSNGHFSGSNGNVSFLSFEYDDTTSATCDIGIMIGNVYISKTFTVTKSIDGQTGNTGITGSHEMYMYAMNGSRTSAPSIVVTDFEPVGWSKTMPNATFLMYIWRTKALVNDAETALASGTWSTPSMISPIAGGAPTGGLNWVSGKTYYGNAQKCDVVKYNDVYYIARADAGTFSSATTPNNDTDHWNNFGGNYESLATEFLWAEGASIANFNFLNQKMSSQAVSANQPYVGIAYNKLTEIKTISPLDYTWNIIGTSGILQPSNSLYTWLKYSNYSDGISMYDVPNNGTKYVGIAIDKSTSTKSSVISDYTWTTCDNLNGIKVPVGAANYTWLKYSVNSNGSEMNDSPLSPNLILDGILGQIQMLKASIGRFKVSNGDIIGYDLLDKERIRMSSDGLPTIGNLGQSWNEIAEGIRVISEDYFELEYEAGIDRSYVHKEMYTNFTINTPCNVKVLAQGETSVALSPTPPSGIIITGDDYVNLYLNGVLKGTVDYNESIYLSEVGTYSVTINADIYIQNMSDRSYYSATIDQDVYMIVAQIPTERTFIGTNGLYSMFGDTSYLYYKSDYGFQVRFGNYGFEVAIGGIKKSSTMNEAYPTWISI